MLNYSLCESILTYESQAGQRKNVVAQDSLFRARAARYTSSNAE
jgi:hypothetical protein